MLPYLELAVEIMLTIERFVGIEPAEVADDITPVEVDRRMLAARAKIQDPATVVDPRSAEQFSVAIDDGIRRMRAMTAVMNDAHRELAELHGGIVH